MQLNAEWAGEAAAWLDANQHPVRPLLDSFRVDGRGLAYGRQIPATQFAALLDFGAAHAGDDYFGLHRGADFDLDNGGVLTYLAACADTLGEATQQLRRYVAIVCDGFTVELEPAGDTVRIVLHVSDPVWGRCRHLPEFFFARLVKGMRLVTGLQISPQAVEFIHSRPAPDAECQRWLGCNVAFGTAVDAIVLPQASFALPIPTADERLAMILIHYADGLLQQQRPELESLVGRITGVVARRLSSGEVSLRDVAGRLHMSERTLRRRLQESGLSFNELVRRVRRNLADDWLQRGDFNVKHISFLLGYSDTTAFSRAYKRWTGRSPSAPPPPG